MYEPSKIKNFCVLAHVDHGKTTLCDYFICSNGVISPSIAGDVRFMDSREDEQEKQITVKTSVISLAYEDSIFNLVDSPGHFDFTSEVSVALRLCESAFLLIDIVDGMTHQTEYLMRNAFAEGVSLCLVFSKIDLMFTTMGLTTREMEAVFVDILNKCNALVCKVAADEPNLLEDETSVEYFSPSKGNVLFTSAKWGLGFSISDMARSYHSFRKWSLQTMEKTLWGPYTYDSKCERIRKRKDLSDEKESMFENFVLNPIEEIVRSFASSASKQEILDRLRMQVPFDFTAAASDHPIFRMETALGKWCPLGECLMRTAKFVFPSAQAAQMQHFDRLIAPGDKYRDTTTETREYSQFSAVSIPQMENSLRACQNAESPSIAFIAKITRSNSGGDDYFIAVSRILSGAFTTGQTIQVWSGDDCRCVGIIQQLSLFQGNELIHVKSVGAGTICAIQGDFVENMVKFGTISDVQLPRPIRGMRILYPSVFRTVVRPEKLSDRIPLGNALRVLNSLDLQLDVNIEDNGDFVLGTAGIVHTERCVTDLRTISEVEVEISEPVIPLMETIHNHRVHHAPAEEASPNSKKVCFNMMAFGLPQALRQIVDVNILENAVEDLLKDLKIFDGSQLGRNFSKEYSFHPSKRGNLLIVRRPKCLSGADNLLKKHSILIDVLSSSFHLAMKQGPLGRLPLTGVCVVIRDIRNIERDFSILDTCEVQEDEHHELLSVLPRNFLREIQTRVSVLVEPCYECEVIVKSDAPLGKLYAIINERRGHIISEECWNGILNESQRYVFLAKIPVIESQKVIDAIHAQCGGKADCQFFASGWEDIVDYTLSEISTGSNRESGLRGASDHVTNRKPDFIGSTTWAMLEKFRQNKGVAQQIQLPKDAEKQKFANRAA
ncbi:translation elongation factor EF-2 [Perkinsela sp. CCAP 1560/4]|nr:translation elongation factor EF-2 [Perkinsela sp. CCAP 1560/4]|eukprot:KNH09550.1 translation elongation factor EF-2 [Perkinsela sp. CCAP 1560/4]